ncbi:MAG TPA: metabolite traffic protein EboE [Patescibacteria group bacterium]|nr:metabolite traffic protein EboE [Patescibacteria group bacterium]
MKLNQGLHLAYCTNVHPGETWAETFESLNRWTLKIKERVAPRSAYAIGLRLSDQASRELSDGSQFLQFQRWLERHQCYVFTLNGFPFGRFHGGPVKEQVYAPDWTDLARLDYTNRLFDLLEKLLPEGIEGSVSTLPGSFKEFIHGPDQLQLIRNNIWKCVEHVARLSERTGRTLHLGLEPEPLGLFENSTETIRFFDELRAEHRGDARLDRHLGVNYDTCHFAVEFEEPKEAVARLRSQGIRLSKIHISSALKLQPTAAARTRLAAFAEDVYLHQVIVRRPDGSLERFKDLPLALDYASKTEPADGEEWRVHFHVPLHCAAPDLFETTADHAVGLFGLLRESPDLCSHLEMETYTWSVLPNGLRTREVSEQIVSEYGWTLKRMSEHGLVPAEFIDTAQ